MSHHDFFSFFFSCSADGVCHSMTEVWFSADIVCHSMTEILCSANDACYSLTKNVCGADSVCHSMAEFCVVPTAYVTACLYFV